MSAAVRLAAGVVGAAVVLSGCGYSARRPFPKDVRTVHVEMFASREFRRGIEFDLTEALAKRIQQDTPYRLAERERADTVLTGEVKEFRQAALVSDFRTGLPREIAGVLVVSFRWRDQRTGEILAENENLLQHVEYIPSLDEGEPIGLSRAIERMAERIVEQMESPW